MERKSPVRGGGSASDHPWCRNQTDSDFPQCTDNRRKRRSSERSVSPFDDVRKNGRGERIRTSDPLVPNQVLYQAEPLPELVIGGMLTDLEFLADPSYRTVNYLKV